MNSDPLVMPCPRTMTHPIKIPSVLECGFLIAGLKLALAIVGFRRTVLWLARHLRPVPIVSDVPVEALKQTEYAVAMAGALYPGRARCLEQSMTLYYVLRRQGVAARFRLGVQPYPFEAHSWVEYQAQPINDAEEHVQWFTPLPDQLV